MATMTVGQALFWSAAATAATTAATGGFNNDRDLHAGRVGPAENKKTSEALPQTSEAAKKNRKQAASVMAKDFQAPTLGTPGLLGI